ncbi:MAG: ankyrin repeat domain-containing protein [Terrimonas sp.]|nr:ankyrin repeat domain-containing protein [Terrimonas sp.]
MDQKVVNEFVKVAHTNLDRLKELLEAYPLLLNASWDWGGGDFETAIGAAGHMGHKEFAHYLISKGARYDIFVMTMLGKTRIVKTILDEYPELLHSQGPHGFTLLHHAEKGGEDGKELFTYFESKGLKEKHIKLYQ